MTNNKSFSAFKERMNRFQEPQVLSCLSGIRHGVERETLRVDSDGKMSTSSHPKNLGSALKHSWITTDFSESLLEFITPPEISIKKTIGQLVDIHKFVTENLNDELLWPLSMPCFIDSSTNIPIARYGKSNIAKMKETYRMGLHHRYGSMMQVISGVHLNFSFSDEFWVQYFKQEGKEANKDTISKEYFSLIRNFRRNAWIIPYLFGASPALCGSFIAHKNTHHKFEKLGKGTLYLPHATSLRMSDLGYTSSAQSGLRICYDSLDNYVNSLRKAISLPAPEYKAISKGEDGKWHQLNDNVLQIENELYAPVRPKQVAEYLEKPTDALAKRGVSYIEIRGLDVNPFSQVGIDEQQIKFIDAFMLACLIMPPSPYSDEDHERSKENMNRVVLQGRDETLTLLSDDGEIALKDHASNLFELIREAAKLLDKANMNKDYGVAVEEEFKKVQSPELCYSGQLLAILKGHDIDNSMFGLSLANEYKRFIEAMDYRYFNQQDFEIEANSSFEKQAELEQQDDKSFAQFVADYFENKHFQKA